MIERTFDYRKVKKILGINPLISNEIIYLLESNIGLWIFHKYLNGLMVHADMTPECRGKRAVESAKNAFKWVFQNTNTKIIYAGIPKKNKPACHSAVGSGMNFTHEDENKRYYEVEKCPVLIL